MEVGYSSGPAAGRIDHPDSLAQVRIPDLLVRMQSARSMAYENLQELHLLQSLLFGEVGEENPHSGSSTKPVSEDVSHILEDMNRALVDCRVAIGWLRERIGKPGK